MKQKKDKHNNSNKHITGFEVMYSSSGNTRFYGSEGYHRMLDRVYEMQRNDIEREREETL